jgi:hypothetical protein
MVVKLKISTRLLVLLLDLGPGIWDLGSGIWDLDKTQDPGSGINILDPKHCFLSLLQAHVRALSCAWSCETKFQ